MGMSGRLLRPAGRFTPKNIAGLALWLDGSQASSITLNGSTVSQWDDLSGNGRHATQATAASQPTFTASARNGRSALTFGGSQTMSVAAFPVTNYASGVAVVQFSANNQAVFQRGVLNEIHSVFYEAGVVKLRNVGAAADATSALSANVFCVIGFSVFSQFASSGSQTSDLRVNGVAATQAQYTVNSSQPADKAMTIGGLSATVYRLNGTLCELVYYQGSSAVPTALLSKLERSLGSKWGVSVA